MVRCRTKPGHTSENPRADAHENPVRADNPVTLCDLRVLVDEAAKAVAPDDTRWAIDGGRFGRADTIGASLPE